MIGMTEVLGDFGFANMVGLRFSSIAISRPSGGNDSLAAHIVAAGTHDDPVNTVSVWSAELVQDPQFSDGLLSHEALGLDDARGPPPAPLRVLPASPPSPATRPSHLDPLHSANPEPKRRWCWRAQMDGSVRALQFWDGAGVGDGAKLWAGTSAGTVALLSVERTGDDASPAVYHVSEVGRAAERGGAGKSLHALSTSAIASDAEGKLALSAGEDGAVFELRADAGGVQATRCGGACDWVALADVAFAEAGQAFFTAGTAGGVKMWDLNMPGQARAFSLTGDGACAPATAVQSFGVHVIAGGEDGHVAVFDSRHERAPLTVHSAPAPAPGFHVGPVRSIRGSDERGQRFVSCGGDGSVLSFAPGVHAGGAIAPLQWTRYSQGVHSVDAVVCHRGRRQEAALTVAASDSGLLLSYQPVQ